MLALEFDKRTTRIIIENICGRLRQYALELRNERVLSLDGLAEQITFCVLREMRDASCYLGDTEIDQQLMISVALGMQHACLQDLTNAAPPPQNPIVWDKELVN